MRMRMHAIDATRIGLYFGPSCIYHLHRMLRFRLYTLCALTLSWSRLAGVVTAVSYSFSPILSACEEASVAGEDGGVGGYVESVARDSLRVPPISKARVRSHITCAP